MLKGQLYITDTCLDVQCEYGAACVVSPDLSPTCTCAEIGDGQRQSVKRPCLTNDDGHEFLNVNDMRKAMCSSQTDFVLAATCEGELIISVPAILTPVSGHLPEK